jgi:hypothetical protein
MKTVLSSILIGIFCLLVLHRLNYRERDEIVSRFFMRVLFLFLLTSLALIIFNQLTSYPHALLGEVLFAPGSLITRSIFFPSSYHIRRLIEPSALFFILVMGAYSHALVKSNARTLMRFGLLGVTCTLWVEGYYLANQKFLSSQSFTHFPTSYFWVFSMSCVFISMFIETIRPGPFRLVYKKSSLSGILIVPLTFWILFFSHALSSTFSNTPSISQIAAHYYVWFPENWSAGYPGKPPSSTALRPYPSEYMTEDKETISRQLSQMEDGGISLLLLDWWPRKPHLKNRAVKITGHIPESSSLRFAAHVETLDIAKNESRDIIFMGERETIVLCLFIEHLVKRLASHSHYYRIDNKPVIFLYASRHLVGDIRKAISQVRLHVREKTGEDLYLVGDEVFYNVPDANNTMLLPPLVPSWERISAFDAITLYNPYNPDTLYEDEDKGALLFLKESEALYRAYRGFSETSGIPFIPSIIPGYDDRVLRPALHSPPIIRSLGTGESMLEKMFHMSTSTMSHSMTDTVIITSWNEWNEGTQIEPGIIEGSTTPDLSYLKMTRSWKNQKQ